MNRRLFVLALALAFVAPPALARGGRLIQQPAPCVGAACGMGGAGARDAGRNMPGTQPPSYGVKPQGKDAFGGAPRNEQFGAMKPADGKSKGFNTELKPLHGVLPPRK